MSFPTLGMAVEGTPFREAQSCLGPKFAGSTYKFFLSGTNTPANVYQNGTLTTAFPITGSVVSDNFGRFPAIYLNPAIIYRVQFFNSANVQVWQQDPYVSQLSTVGTSSLTPYGAQIATTGEVVIPAPNTGGSGISLTLNSGSLGTWALKLVGTLAGNSTLIINNSATTGSQTATFAATNKPGTATSAPAGWLPITCDGVQYYTPIWHGNPFSPYVSSPSAQGEVINASTVTFTGNGLTTVTGGSATPSNWFSPTAAGIGASYYINITKTSGGSGIQFSAANGTWTNIGSGGLTIGTNAQAPISGTYQLSTSVSGSPIVASGTITLQNNNGVQSPTYNGAANLMLNGDGSATLNGGTSSNWFAPTTANVGSGYYIQITQTGGSSGAAFSTALSAPVNITNAGLSIGITGGSGTTNVTGTYIISSDSAGTVQLGAGTITLTGGSNVQSPNYSGTTALNLAGNGTATLNGAGTSAWYVPTTGSIGAGYYINITRTGGTAGVNFTQAQGAWTNITASGLTIDINGYTGDVGTVSASGTYQISSSNTGTPVLGGGNISLSLSGLTAVRTYNSTGGGSGTETVPTGATMLTAEAVGAGAGGGYNFGEGGGGGGGAYVKSVGVSVTGGQTFSYSYAPGGIGNNNNAGGAPTPASSTITGTGVSITAAAGGGGSSGSTAGGAGGAASGGNTTNANGAAGATGSGTPSVQSGGNSGQGTGGGNPGGGNPGGGAAGGSVSGGPGSLFGGPGLIRFTYS